MDMETASEVDRLVPTEPLPSAGVRRRAIFAAAGAVGVVAPGAAALTLSLRGSRSAAERVSLSGSVSGPKYRMGCSNWRDIMIKHAAYQDDVSCQKLCDDTQGCHAYNLQPCQCENVGDNQGKAKGSCYIFGAGCEEESNDCWDLYYSTSPDLAFNANNSRMGCKNWYTILIKEFEDKSEAQCGHECSNEPECRQFNIQVSDRTACPGSSRTGACYLYRDGCQQMENECWDLYDNVVTTSVVTP